MESALNNVIEKISSYEIFNNIIPGVIYSVLTEKLTDFHITTENFFMNIVFLYFIGLIVGRMGSIFSDFIGWCFRKLGWKPFLNFSPYYDYISVESKDDNGRIRNLVMISNMYRTFASLAFCLICTILLDLVWHSVSVDDNCRILAIIIFFFFLVVLFAFSYKKQTSYITERIIFVLKKEEKEDGMVKE